MKFGELHNVEHINAITGQHYVWKEPYKLVTWREWHTNNAGEGLWHGEKQILGTCQFSVAGCTTEKSAKAKVRKWAKSYEELWERW